MSNAVIILCWHDSMKVIQKKRGNIIKNPSTTIRAQLWEPTNFNDYETIMTQDNNVKSDSLTCDGCENYTPPAHCSVGLTATLQAKLRLLTLATY